MLLGLVRLATAVRGVQREGNRACPASTTPPYTYHYRIYAFPGGDRVGGVLATKRHQLATRGSKSSTYLPTHTNTRMHVYPAYARLPRGPPTSTAARPSRIPPASATTLLTPRPPSNPHLPTPEREGRCREGWCRETRTRTCTRTFLLLADRYTTVT